MKRQRYFDVSGHSHGPLILRDLLSLCTIELVTKIVVVTSDRLVHFWLPMRFERLARGSDQLSLSKVETPTLPPRPEFESLGCPGTPLCFILPSYSFACYLSGNMTCVVTLKGLALSVLSSLLSELLDEESVLRQGK